VYDHHLRFPPVQRPAKTENHVATASIKKPIHNVKEARSLRAISPDLPVNRFLHLWKSVGMVEPIGIEPMT
jgi:hypothetical protein